MEISEELKAYLLAGAAITAIIIIAYTLTGGFERDSVLQQATKTLAEEGITDCTLVNSKRYGTIYIHLKCVEQNTIVDVECIAGAKGVVCSRG